MIGVKRIRQILWGVCGLTLVGGSLAGWYGGSRLVPREKPAETALETLAAPVAPPDANAVVAAVEAAEGPENPPGPPPPPVLHDSANRVAPDPLDELRRAIVVEEAIPYPGDPTRSTIIYSYLGTREVLRVGQYVNRRTGEPLRSLFRDGRMTSPDYSQGVQLADVVADRALFRGGKIEGWVWRKAKPEIARNKPPVRPAPSPPAGRPGGFPHPDANGFPPPGETEFPTGDEPPPEEGFNETEEVGPNHWQVSDDDMQEMYENREEFLSELNLVPQSTSDGSLGARISKVEGTRAGEFGFKKDDVIRAIGGRRVSSLSELQSLFASPEMQRRGSVEIEVERNGRSEKLRFDLSRMR